MQETILDIRESISNAKDRAPLTKEEYVELISGLKVIASELKEELLTLQSNG